MQDAIPVDSLAGFRSLGCIAYFDEKAPAHSRLSPQFKHIGKIVALSPYHPR
jgi:hypothetical protein